MVPMKFLRSGVAQPFCPPISHLLGCQTVKRDRGAALLSVGGNTVGGCSAGGCVLAVFGLCLEVVAAGNGAEGVAAGTCLCFTSSLGLAGSSISRSSYALAKLIVVCKFVGCWSSTSVRWGF